MPASTGSVSSSFPNTAAQSITLTCPQYTQPGDLLLAFPVNSLSALYTLPTGWKLVAQPAAASSDVGSGVFYRIADSTDVAGTTTYTFTCAGTLAAQGHAGAIVRVINADTSQLASSWPAARVGLTHGTTASSGSFPSDAPTNPTTINAKDLLIRIYIAGEESAATPNLSLGAAPTGWTSRVLGATAAGTTSSGGYDIGMQLCDQLWNPTSSTPAPPPPSGGGTQTLGVGGVATPAGAILTTADVAGGMNITTSGTPTQQRVYDGQGHTVNGQINIAADYVTIQNFVIRSAGNAGVYSMGQGIVIQNCDIAQVNEGGVGDINGISFFGDGHHILYNTIGVNALLVQGDPKGSHTDGMQTWDTTSKRPSSNVLILGNKIMGPTDINNVDRIHQGVMAEGPASTDGGGGGTGPMQHWLVDSNYFESAFGNQCLKFDGIDDVNITRNTFAGSASVVVYSSSISHGTTYYSDNTVTGSFSSGVGVSITQGSGPSPSGWGYTGGTGGSSGGGGSTTPTPDTATITSNKAAMWDVYTLAIPSAAVSTSAVPLSSLTDDFSGAAINTKKWPNLLNPAGVSQNYGAGQAAADSTVTGFGSAASYVLKESHASVQITPPPKGVIVPANPGEALWIGAAAGKNHFNVGIGNTGATGTTDHTQASIESGFAQSPQFVLTAASDTQFRIGVNDGTVSGSSYPRSELRELQTDGVTNAAWDPTTGTHSMKWRFRVTHVAATKPWVCVGEIHDGSSEVCRLQTENGGGGSTGLRLRLRHTPPGGAEVAYDAMLAYELNQWVAAELRVVNGQISLYLDGNLVKSGLNGAGTNYYFKAGCYAQSNTSTENGDTTQYFSTEIAKGSLVITHPGYPVPTTPTYTGGTGTGSGGSAYAQMQLLPDPSGSPNAKLIVQASNANNLNQLAFNYTADGTTYAFQKTFTYDPVNHSWLRVRETNSTLYLEGASDGAAWAVIDSEATPALFGSSTTTRVNLVAYDPTNGAGLALFDNFNVSGSLLGTGVLSVPTTFTDGMNVRAVDLNGVSAAIENLCQVSLGLPTVAAPISQPFCKVYLTAAQSVANASTVPIQFGAAASNVDGMWNTSYNYIVLINHPGWYRVEAQAAFDTGAINTERQLLISVNGSTSYSAASNATISSSVAINHRMQTTALLKLNQGDSVGAFVFQNSGAAINLLAQSATSATATWGTYLSAVWEAPYV